MSYTANIMGHVEGATPEETHAKEAGVIERVREFAASLEGATQASVSASQHGHVEVHGPQADAADADADAVPPQATG